MIELVAVVSMIIDHVGFVFFPEMMELAQNSKEFWVSFFAKKYERL